jgi:hypothetical protein
MKQVEHWIPDAIQVIMEDGFCKKDTLKIDKEFKGYFANFGASLIQSGLLPAVIFFENEQGDAKADRPKVPKAILHLLTKKYSKEQNPYLHDCQKLSDYLLKSPLPNSKNLALVSKASVALKIALRTFDLKS